MTRGQWLRRVLIAGGLLCGLAPVLPAQTLIQGTYREDAAHTSGDPGLFTLAVRRAIGSGLCGTDGDYCALQVDANGALHVVFANTTIAVTNAGTFAVQAAQSGTWTVQPGNTANTTAWLVTGTGGTFPVTGTFWQATQPVSIAATVTVDSELPAAAAASDNFANPTAPSTLAHAMVWDGATWDRWTGAVTGAGDGAIQDGASSSIEATVFDYTNSNPLSVRLTDTSGDYVGAGAGTQYNQGTATTDTDTMTMAGAVRRDTAAVATGVADGDRLALSTDSAGRLRMTAVDTTQPVSGTVTVTDGAGALNVIVDSSALPSGAATAANQTTTIGHVDGIEGLLATIDGDTGTIAGAVAGSEMQVDVVTSALPTGAATLAEQQTQTTALQLIDDTVRSEDTASAGGHSGLVVNTVRTDTPGTTTSDDGDYQPLKSDTSGYLYVSVGNQVNAEVQGLINHDSNAIPGSVQPLLIGGVANAAAPASVSADEDAVNAWFLRNGAQATVLTAAGALIGGDATNGLDVDVTRSALPTGAATSAEQATQTASLSVLDDWDESDRAKVNPIVGQAGVQGGAGAVSATTQRVAMATDANAVDRTAVAAANNDGGCVTVDGTSDAILASFATRRGATILNNGTVTFFLKLGATATTSDFPVAPGGVYNLGGASVYTGAVDGITASSSTSVCVVEF